MIQNIATIDVINLALDKLGEIKYNDMNSIESKVVEAKNTLISYRDKLQNEVDESDKWAKEQSEIHDMLELENEMSHNQAVNNDEKKGGI
mgnify:CR=1 FL=1|tara:strand:+ start:69 stop:338 length:270 start_codon:yes stop_codon:yes gene_type:complete